MFALTTVHSTSGGHLGCVHPQERLHMPLGDLCGKFCWLRVGNELESQGMHSQPL